jgi:hypothetical protein
MKELAGSATRAARLTGGKTAAQKGSGTTVAKDIPREAINETLGSLSPGLRFVFAAAGRTPYIGPSGYMTKAHAGDYSPLGIGRDVISAGDERKPLGPALKKTAAGYLGVRLSEPGR